MILKIANSKNLYTYFKVTTTKNVKFMDKRGETSKQIYGYLNSPVELDQRSEWR